MDDWSRFYNIAFRIRTGKLHNRLHLSLVAEICSIGPHRSPLLPLITCLDLTTGLNGHSSLFIGPTLDALTLEVTADNNIYTDPHLLTRVPILSPSITRLTWYDEVGYSGSAVPRGIADVVRSLPKLRFIDVSEAMELDEGPLLSALVQCQFLEEMVLWGNGQNMAWSSAVAEPFRSLRRLKVKQSSDDVFASFLKSLPPNLVHLEYGCNEYISLTGHFGIVMKAVSSHHQLESLIVTSGCTESDVISLQILQPLTSCSHLRVISFVTDDAVEMTDGDIAQLTSRLPRLEDFTLMGRGTDQRHPLPSLGALAAIVASCPAIRNISLHLETSPAQLPLKDNLEASDTLRCVDVQLSSIQNPKMVALFFEKLVTSEDFELVHDHGANEGGTGWNQVSSLLRDAASHRTTIAAQNAPR